MWVLNTSSPLVRKNCGQSEYYYAKNQAVPNEEGQRAASEEIEEEADDDPASDGAGQNPHQEHGSLIGGNAAVVLHQVPEIFGGSARNRGYQKQEREPCGRLALQIAKQ